MRNVFLFLRRYRTFFSFLILQVVALWFLFSYNRFHRAKFLGVANEVTGRINTQYNKVEDYFSLKEENRRVHRLNDSLLNLLRQNYNFHDTSAQIVRDTLIYDTAGGYRRYIARPATVVYCTVNSQKNYIQINRGSNQGIRDNWAVISSDGAVVGLVVNVSPNFSQVMSLLHRDNSVNSEIKGNKGVGDVVWDGKDPRYLQMQKVPKTADVKKGDTVLTSHYSFNYPPGYMIGIISDVKLDSTSGTYRLKVRAAANFSSLQQVHVLENTDYPEQVALDKDTKKKMETASKNPR